MDIFHKQWIQEQAARESKEHETTLHQFFRIPENNPNVLRLLGLSKIQWITTGKPAWHIRLAHNSYSITQHITRHQSIHRWPVLC